jgi:hypothetical protein
LSNNYNYVKKLLSGESPEIESFFDGDESGTFFKSRGNEEGKFSFVLCADADLSLSKSVKLYAGIAYRSSEKTQIFGINCGFSYHFSSLAR